MCVRHRMVERIAQILPECITIFASSLCRAFLLPLLPLLLLKRLLLGACEYGAILWKSGSYQCVFVLLVELVSLWYLWFVASSTCCILEPQMDHIADGPGVSILIHNTRMSGMDLQSICEYDTATVDDCCNLPVLSSLQRRSWVAWMRSTSG